MEILYTGFFFGRFSLSLQNVRWFAWWKLRGYKYIIIRYRRNNYFVYIVSENLGANSLRAYTYIRRIACCVPYMCVAEAATSSPILSAWRRRRLRKWGLPYARKTHVGCMHGWYILYIINNINVYLKKAFCGCPTSPTYNIYIISWFSYNLRKS